MSNRISFYEGVLNKDSLDKLKQIGSERVEMFLCENGEVVFLRTGDCDTREESFEKLIQKYQRRELENQFENSLFTSSFVEKEKRVDEDIDAIKKEFGL